MTPVRLDFGYQDYERHGTEDEVRELVAGRSGMRTPCSSPARRSATRTTSGSCGPSRTPRSRPGASVSTSSSPTASARAEPTPPWLWVALGGPLGFEDAPAGLRDRLAKWRAVRAYESQLPLLALDGRKALAVVRASERIAWLDGSRL